MIDKVLYGAFLMYLLFACGTDYYVDIPHGTGSVKYRFPSDLYWLRQL